MALETSVMHLFPSTTITYVIEDAPKKLKMPMPLSDLLLLRVLEDDDKMDLTFICDDGEVNAHRLIVAAASNFLAHLLSDFDQDDCECATIILPGVTVEVMETVRILCYGGMTTYRRDIEDDVFTAMQMLLVGDKGNFMISMTEEPSENEKSHDSDLSLLLDPDLLLDIENLSGISSCLDEIEWCDENIEELVKSCSTKCRNQELVAAALEEFEKRKNIQPGACSSDLVESEREDSSFDIIEDIIPDDFGSELPNCPSVETEEKATQTEEVHMKKETKSEIIREKRGRKRKRKTGVRRQQPPRGIAAKNAKSVNDFDEVFASTSKSTTHTADNADTSSPAYRLRKRSSTLSNASLDRNDECSRSRKVEAFPSTSTSKIHTAHTLRPTIRFSKKNSTLSNPSLDENNKLLRQKRQESREASIRRSLAAISSLDDSLFIPVTVRKKDQKYLITPSTLQAVASSGNPRNPSRSKKSRPSLDINKIGNLYKSLGALTSKSDTSSPSSSSPPSPSSPVDTSIPNKKKKNEFTYP